MAQLQPRRKLMERTIQVPAAIQSTSVNQNEIVSEQQSFAMVQSTLRTSVAILAYLRNLLPERCYDWVDYESIHPKRSFARMGSVEGERPDTPTPRRFNGASRRAGYRTIARGRAKNGDQLLDWLDKILDGIQKHTIAAVQFSIYSDQQSSSNIIESYRFGFQYIQIPEDRSHQVIGMTLAAPNGVSVSGKSAVSRLEKIHDCLYNWSNNAPDLPDIRFLMCHLLHTPSCRPDHLPKGFQQCKDTTVFVPDGCLWHMKEKEVGEMSSGFHSVSLNVGYIGIREGSRADSDVQLKIPRRLVYAKAFPRFPNLPRSLGMESAMATTVATPKKVSMDTDEELCRESPLFNRTASSGCTVDLDKNVAGPAQSQYSIGSFLAGNHCLTGSKSYWSDDSNDDDLVFTQRVHPYSQAMLGIQLVRWKWLEMIAKRDAYKTSRQDISELQAGYTVRCECGFGEEEGTMAQCDCCGNWQHDHCYGFKLGMPHDERHFCYRCLLEKSDGRRLQDLERLAQFRRAIWLAYQGEYPGNLKKLGKLLIHDKATETEVRSVIRRMKDEGYLVRGKGSQFTRADSTEQIQKRDRDYSNPRTFIGDLYEVIEEERPYKRLKST